MIPTRHKAKLSKALTWPIGAAAISDALVGVPHFADLSLWFADAPMWPASKFRQVLHDGDPYAVMVAEYQPPMRFAQALHLVRWELRINPVLRTLRSTANSLLRADGLPAVIEWLTASTTVGWEERAHRLELIFAPSQSTLSQKTFDGV